MTSEPQRPHITLTIDGEPRTAKPIHRGWCVKDLGDGRCIDVRVMLVNYRLMTSFQNETGDHDRYFPGEAFCYFGRTPETAIRAITAGFLWNGTGEPEGYDKRV